MELVRNGTLLSIGHLFANETLPTAAASTRLEKQLRGEKHRRHVYKHIWKHRFHVSAAVRGCRPCVAPLVSITVRLNEKLLSMDVGPNETLLSMDVGPKETLRSMDVGPNETLLSMSVCLNETLLSMAVGLNET